VTEVAKDLLGKLLVTFLDGHRSAGIITEVEAYAGKNDKACHAHGGKITPRNRIMYEEGGKAYVYLCYGIHHLFNVVTNTRGNADAVLIRAVEPVQGMALMQQRRGLKSLLGLTTGPGKLSRALGIHTGHSGLSLLDKHIWIEEYLAISSHEIKATTRIGVAYAGEDALKPWRFYLQESQFVSAR
jgi:DNA-3-methyladenine glycosylase